MATSIKEGLNYIIQAIQNMIEPQLDKLRYDRTYRAKVIEKIEAGLYRVQINGTEYKVNYSGDLNVGDIVKVKAPLNNFSDIYIETLPSSGGSGGTSNYNDLVNKPILNTNNTTGQDINNAETIRGIINLHKISKTGNYTDLRNLPSLDFIPNSQKGAANGVATLNEEKIVVKSNLPSDIVYDSNYVHTDNNFTTALKNKLNGIATGAQVNKIETIQRNGTALAITNKTVNITVPTKTSDLTNDSNFVIDSNYVHTDNNFTTALKNKLDGIAEKATVNAPSTTLPKVAGIASTGAESGYARGDHVHPEQTSVSGNAGTATKLQNARKINNVDFDGTKDINITANPTANQLTNQNLNDIKTPGFYYAGGSNSVTNKPGGTDAFGVLVYRTASGYYTQELTGGNQSPNIKYIRQFNGSAWSNWVKMEYTDTTYGVATTTENGLMSSGDKTKLDGIASGAQVNVIEKIQKNGADLSIVKKTVNITVPTKTSEIINDGEDGTNKFLTQVPVASKTALGGVKIGNNLIITEDGTLSAIGGIGITVVDDLTSTSAIDALSANQGRVLNGKITALDTNIGDMQQDIINIEDNMITTIQKNGTTLPISNKTVNITVPTKTSDLINNSNFVADSNYVHTDNNFTTALKNKLDGIANGATKVIVENNLTSSSIDNALSANQGKNLDINKVTRIYVSNSDIDNISETEFRYTSNSAKTPNGANGYLFTHVFEHNYILQEFTAYNGIQKWVRAKTEGNWNDWGMIWRKQMVLYDNTSGTTGTITIPIHASNFVYIEIFFGKNNSYNSAIVLLPDGKKCNLTLFERSSDTNIQQLISADVLINNYSISKAYVGNINFGTDGSLLGGTGTDNSILIYRVVGYR